MKRFAITRNTDFLFRKRIDAIHLKDDCTALSFRYLLRLVGENWMANLHLAVSFVNEFIKDCLDENVI